MNNIICINNLNYDYCNKKIFDNLSLSIEEGTWVTIAGPNGCGKTTLSKFLSGQIKNECLHFYKIHNIRKDIGLLGENPKNNFIMDTLRDEIILSFDNSKISINKIEERIEDVTDLLQIEDLLDKDPKTFSGGELQRASLACILIYNPKILILDDAFSMINYTEKQNIIKILKRFKKDNNMTIINLTDDLEESFGSNRLIIINQGKIVLDGKPKEVMESDVLINRIGVEIPFIVDLSSKLKLYGLVDDIYFDEDKLVEDIWK